MGEVVHNLRSRGGLRLSVRELIIERERGVKNLESEFAGWGGAGGTAALGARRAEDI